MIISLIIYPMEDRFQFYLKFCLDFFLFILGLFLVLFSTCKNERRRQKYRGNGSVDFLLNFEREEYFKEEEKEGRK